MKVRIDVSAADLKAAMAAEKAEVERLLKDEAAAALLRYLLAKGFAPDTIRAAALRL